MLSEMNLEELSIDKTKMPESSGILISFNSINSSACSDRLEITRLFDSKRLEHCINRIRIEACLEFGKQFARYGRNIHDTRHRQ